MGRVWLITCAWGGGAALLLSLIATPLMRWISFKTRFIDQPSEQRFHLMPTPLLGGVAVFVAMIAAILIVQPHADVFKPLSLYKVFFLGALIAFILGLADDIHDLNPLIKLSGQFFCAMALNFTVGLKYFDSPLTNACLTIFWVLGIINALNFMDNINGLSSGLTVIASIFFFVFFNRFNQTYPALFAATLGGACLGFWFYNYRRKALIFLGDAGAMFMGYLLAAFGLFMAKINYSTPIYFTGSWIILGLLIFDMSMVVFYRSRNKRNVADGGKDHTSHRLVNLGFSELGSVSLLYAVGIILGFIGLYYTTIKPPAVSWSIPIALLIIGLIAGRYLGKAHKYSKD